MPDLDHLFIRCRDSGRPRHLAVTHVVVGRNCHIAAPCSGGDQPKVLRTLIDLALVDR